MNLLEGLKENTDLAYTTNGALVYSTTGESLVDFFYAVGASRRNSNLINIFEKSFKEMPLETLKVLFYARDVREGMGERLSFRRILKHACRKYPDIMLKNVEAVVEFGRYDDLLWMLDTPVEEHVLSYIDMQLSKDINDAHPSLLAKWLPSENASSKLTKSQSHVIRKYLGLSKREYRRMLSDLRRKINIVETHICAKEWDRIEFDKLPSYAMKRYKHVFLNHCPEAYKEYIDSLVKGDKKVNSRTLYPYDIIKEFVGSSSYTRLDLPQETKDLMNEMWKALPDYLEGNEENILVVADTSGSMWGTPYHSALALAIYTAQRNKGMFHNHFITFSERPQLVQIKHERLEDICNSIKSIISNTNIEKVFKLILKTAVNNNLPKEEMPSRIIIVSDMQFDCMTSGNTSLPMFVNMRKQFEEAGYDLPNLVFWNVAETTSNFPMKTDKRGIQMVSGHSPAIFKDLIANKFTTPLELVFSVINKERYNLVTL